MFTSNQLLMLVVVLPPKLLAAEVAEEANGDIAAAMRECIVTLGVFAASVFLFSLRQRSSKKAVKRSDKRRYECPATHRIRTQAPVESTYSKKLNPADEVSSVVTYSKKSSPADEVSSMVQEHTRLSELVLSFAREGNSIKAAMAMKRLEDKCGTANLQEYSALLTMCSKINDVESAQMWMGRLKEKGHAPNVVCFNALINVYAKLGEISKAVAVTEEMRDAGVDCDVVTYNTIIDAFARKGDAADAQVWMKKMLASGVNPSVISFCSVMRACAKAGLNHDLEYWIEQANVRGIQLNMICFSAVINGFAQNDDLTSAEYWISRMTKFNVSPSFHCFTVVVEKICKSGDWDHAARILGRMREVHVVPDARMLSMLVKTACQAGKIECAQDWINESAGKGILLNMQAIPASFAAKLTIPTDVKSDKLVSNVSVVEAPATCGPESAAAQAIVGKRFVGTIKEFVTARYGYVTCEETYAIFKRDVFLSNCDNPKQFAKGQIVSFVLQIDQRRGLPRACDLAVFQR